MSDLEVIGGRGGLEVAVEDLRHAATVLARAAAALEAVAPDVVRVSPWMLVRATGELAGLLLRARLDSGAVRGELGSCVERVRALASSTSAAASGYARAEATSRALVAAIHDQAFTIAGLVTAATGQAFGLLDEGTGWDVEVTPVPAPGDAPVPSSQSPAGTLLAGVEDLAREGRVRVIELPAADGTTTWVVQVPGTHGGWSRSGAVPMDWPANVSLMLGEASASRVAADRALTLAQGGRATPRDRVVLVGHSQGGIVAASLACDPEFTARHRVSHVLTAGSPIDDFPIPATTQVLSLQHATDPVHGFDVSPPPERAHWTTVRASAPLAAREHLRAGAHALAIYRTTAQRTDASADVSLRQWRSGLAPALGPAAGGSPVVHEFRSRRRWQNRPP